MEIMGVDLAWFYWVSVSFFCGLSFMLGIAVCAAAVLPKNGRTEQYNQRTLELMGQRNDLDERKIEVMNAINDRLVEIRDAIAAK